METQEVPKFIVDEMLGKLARWLRMMKFDTIYAKDLRKEFRNLNDRIILNKALMDNRILVTRDKLLYSLTIKYGGKAILLNENMSLKEQLLFILKKIKIKKIPFFDSNISMRCSVCNAPLIKIDKESVRGKVPRGIYLRHNEFWICTNCGKIYWQGSHWDRITETIREVKEKLEKGDNEGEICNNTALEQ